MEGHDGIGAEPMSARELFEDARQAAWELERHDMRYNAMERRALSLGGASDSKVAGGSVRDRMGAVDAMVDYERMMERRVAGWCAVLDQAYAVLYGWDWEHGVATALGLAYAEVLDFNYCQHLSIKETCKRVHFSRPTVYRMRARALNYIDAVGIAAAEKGE